MIQAKSIDWPRKRDLLGVHLSEVTYDRVLDTLVEAARHRRPAIASFFAVHAVVTHGRDSKLRQMVNRFDMIAPDGMPVRWAMNLLYRARLPSNVRGTGTMLLMCERAAREGMSIYLYGGTPETIEILQENLLRAYPGLKIAGAESPPFRKLTEEEDAEVVRRINDSGAHFLFIGLGCPKQDIFASEHQDSIHAVQLCVGAAFDFHAGKTREAPHWMQRSGLEWFYRLCQEPRRLWKRYLVTNTQFVQMVARQGLGMLFTRSRGESSNG
ncbi:MAG: WecB/TagA/CpsF family glycosyltransferase [Planctomycetales bacterium]|nr:WecB/TagA/CpsF family glycosyltransferase [Planctomycetales bacterium]